MDIIERLRELDKRGYQPLTGAIGAEAADEIERLREALEKIAPTDKPKKIVCPNCDSTLPEGCGGIFRNEGKACWLNKEVPNAGIHRAAEGRPVE